MPTSHCRYPEHHTGPGVGLPLGWLASLGAGALIVTHWHEVVVVLVVIAVLAAFGVPVLLLWHNHGRGYDPELERQAAADQARHQLDSRVGTLERQLAVQQQRPAIHAAPVTHQHLHLHGLSAVEVAELVAQRRELPAIDGGQQW